MNTDLMRLLFCFVAPGLLGLVALWHLVNPIGAWKLGRLKARSEGLATDDAPAAGALTVVRVRGVLLLVVAVAFAVFSHMFWRGWDEQRSEKPPALTPFP